MHSEETLLTADTNTNVFVSLSLIFTKENRNDINDKINHYKSSIIYIYICIY